ncbi:MAG: YggT family protein [Oligoflexia bacterium]|nr:YggT family protein [Oligoflexia bacterium]
MIRFLINIYVLVIITDAVLSYLPQFRHHQWVQFIKKLADYSLDPIRKLLPRDTPFDISPLIVIVILQLIIALW